MRFSAVEQRVLRYLEERFVAGGRQRFVMPDELMRDQGLGRTECARLMARLRVLAVLKDVCEDGTVEITDAVCHFVAELSQEASSPPSSGPIINVMHVGSLSHSSIQQGTVNSSQATFGRVMRQAIARADLARPLLLLTVATDVERDAVLSVAFADRTAVAAPQFHGDHTYFDLGVHGGCSVLLVKTGMGGSGVTGSLATLLDATHDLSLSAIVMVGIAFGVSQEHQRIGDLLVSRQVLCYECQRVTEVAPGTVTIIPRGDRVSASPLLLDRFDAGSVGWRLATVRFGLILSGDKLVDSPSFKQQLLALEPEAIGGEMEAAGMYASAYKGKVDWIMVKGICDWGENKSNPNKKHDQALAAHNAAAFVFHVLRQGGLTTLK